MRAAVLEDINRLLIKEKDLPKCQFGELLIKVKACGICRTDMKCVTLGQRDLRLPRVLGHEIAGTVVEIGNGIENYQQGDRVQIAPGISCGSCHYCQNGLDHLCSDVKIIGFNYDGGFEDYILIPQSGIKNGNLNFIPEEVSFREASITEPLACSINMQNSLKLNKTDTLLLFGAGRLGILNLRLAKARGINKVIVIENNKKRSDLAKQYEFDYILNPQEVNIYKEISAITNNKGVDAVIPCCPGSEPMYDGLELLVKRGKLGFFSGLIFNQETFFDINKIHYHELTVCGAYGCSINDNRDALGYISTRKVVVSDIFTKIIDLNEVNKGIELVKNIEEISVVIEY